MKLHYAKPSTYCQKVMIAFKEKQVEFTSSLVNLMDPTERASFAAKFPLGKIPLLELNDGTLIPESTIIVEYLDDKYTSGTKLIPTDKEHARKARLFDRLFDLYLNENVSTVMFDSFKPEHERDPAAVAEAKAGIETLYKFLDKELAKTTWATGEHFTIADCAAFAPLFYAKETVPFAAYKNIGAYFNRLVERKSANEVMQEVIPEIKRFMDSRK